MSDLDAEKRGTDELWLPTVVEDDSAKIKGALHADLAGEFPQPKRVPVPVAATLRTIEHVLPMRSRSPVRHVQIRRRVNANRDIARMQKKRRRGQRFAGGELVRVPLWSHRLLARLTPNPEPPVTVVSNRAGPEPTIVYRWPLHYV